MKNEVWKDISGYEGYYQISNFGRIKSIKRTITRKDGKAKTFSPVMLKQNIGTTGYSYANLSQKGKAKSERAHRLVAEAFIGNPENLPCINHIDENKTNNKVENLEWCSYRYNNTYNDKQLCRATPVLQFTTNGEFVRKHRSQAEAEKAMGRGRLNISACCRGKIKSCAGYVWKYVA